MMQNRVMMGDGLNSVEYGLHSNAQGTVHNYCGNALSLAVDWSFK